MIVNHLTNFVCAIDIAINIADNTFRERYKVINGSNYVGG